jgi:serine/threonine protein kinase/tetratricopeptide (TPR) repeat protein
MPAGSHPKVALVAPADLTLPERFEIVRPLGEGGMGMVFEAFDRERNARVALKTLKRLVTRRQGAQALLRFKREFRALQDLHHRNLVSLGELIAEGEQWFFTMELVEGLDLLAYVRPRPPMEAEGLAVLDAPREKYSSSVDDPPMQFLRMPSQRVRSAPAVLDEVRLRSALPQLASGLDALHAAGKVHRDIKPSNIRVTPAGRVVLLDFGLVADVAERPSIDGDITGTPAYMAPEQVTAAAAGPAADWYALGVLLYESLTGELPFEGSPIEVLMQKQRELPPPPSTRATGVPADLEALCMKLLRMEPAARPTGAAVLRMLESGSTSTAAVDISRSTRSTPFVGRAAEVEKLDQALRDSRRSAVVTLVEGESGIGKSCLVRNFGEHVVATDPDAVVLAGRCYEREQVPYKGFDGVIDELARYMTTLPDEQAFALLPSRVGPLVQVFPVLRRSPAFAFATTEESSDPHELRRRAFAGLREVLARVAARHALVIAIDDLQWADADSLSLLAELLRPPSAPQMLLVATVRDAPGVDGTIATAPVGITDVEARLPCPSQRISLGRLSDDDARELATSLLEMVAPHRAKDAGAIAREAHGHPLFIDELARHAALVEEREIAGDEPDDTALMVRPAFDLEEALSTRIARLGDTAKRTLELVSVAGRPLTQETVAHAAGMEMGAFGRAVAELRVAHLVVTAGARAADRIEPYHERVRSAVVAHVSKPDRTGYHRRLALALEAARWPDGEALSVHWAKAGDRERAAKHAVAAAHQASEALAFDRAATCWERALKLTPHGDPKRRALYVRLAEALANSGRGTLAAPVYLKAAEGAEPGQALDLRRRAAEQYLRSGRFDEGIRAVKGVLALLGLTYPRSPLHALVQLVLLRFVLLLRGMRFKERDSSLIPARDLLRVDVCWSVAFALALSDHIFGAVFQVRAVLYALQAGEPTRVARALAVAAGYQATGGGRASARVEKNLARARSLAERTRDPQSIAYTVANSAISHYLTGRFRHAVDDCDRAASMFRDRVPGTAWEQATMQLFALNTLGCLGHLAEIQRRQPLYLRDALERGDLYGSVSLRIGWGSLVWLARDDTAGARHEVDEAMQSWSKKGCHLEHFYELVSRTNVDLYDGQAREALARTDDRIVALRRALLLRIATVRIWCAEMGGRSALAVAQREPVARPMMLRKVEAGARAILREGAPWATPLGHLLRAGVASLRGRRDRAIVLLREAIYGFESADMSLYAAAARRRLASLVGGDEGESLLAQTDAWFREQQVTNVEALTAMVAPGYDAVNSAGARPVEPAREGSR